MASLVVLTGARKGSRLALEGERTVLGRDAGCDVVIDRDLLGRADARTDSVSRRHAVISRVDGGYAIEDGDGRGNKSRNGVLVNDRRVPFPGSVRLRHDDRIRICDFACTFHDDDGGEGVFSVEASIDHDSSLDHLDAQPAEKLRVVLEISNVLSAALELDELLPRIVGQLLRLFAQASRGFIILQDDPSGPLAVRAFDTRSPAGAGGGRFSASVVRRCLQRKEAILGNDLPVQFPDSDSVSALPARSLLCAPLVAHGGAALGAVLLDAEGPDPRFSQEDLSLLVGVASQASVALSNARLHKEALAHQRRERDLEIAREVQRALLPRRLPEVPGYGFSARYEPAQQVGGDYYDFLPLPGRRLAVLLGDVAGKGVAAALVMARFGVEARVCLEAEPDLPAAVARLNDVMVRAALPDRFVTLAAVVLDPAAHAATLVNAGHPSPLLIRHATGELEEAAPAEVAGPPLGVHANHVYEGREVRMLPGDSLVLFSDGVTDAQDGQGRAFRMRGIRAVLTSGRLAAGEAAEQLFQAVKRHARGCAPHDDVTVVCLGRAGV
jgi:serine phosphatase RsbU (regulator of sigma subunit)